MVTMFIGGVPGEVLPILTLMDPSAKWTRETPRLMISAMSVERRQDSTNKTKLVLRKKCFTMMSPEANTRGEKILF